MKESRAQTLRSLRVFGPLAVTVLSGVWMVGWGCDGTGDSQRAPEIILGKDTCQGCIMIVSDARYAAGYTDEDGMPRAFDDIGCMVEYVREREDFPYVLWVSDYDTRGWVRAASAWFVRSDDFITPMGSGLVAVGSEPTARELAASHSGAVLQFGELTAGETAVSPR